MKNAKYWQERMELLEKRSNVEGKKTYKRVEDAFLRAEREITEKTEAWYGRFAKNNNVTLQEAKKLLNSNELKEFKWDVWEYIKKGEESNLNGKWIKELENASSKFHITRLDALKLQMQQYLEIAFGNELDEIDRMARKVMTENYYHTCFEVQKGFNIGWDIGQIDERKLSLYLSRPWTADGIEFSKRIWRDKTKLINELGVILEQSCINCSGIKKLVDEFSSKMATSKKIAARLILTEQAYFHSVSQKEAFNELDIEKYEIVATLDSHTSETCRHMDGKNFYMRDYKPNVTAPPFHCRCRSVTAPYFEDDLTIGQRAARGEDGKTYYVPGDMTYKEWERKFVDKKDKSDRLNLEEQAALLKYISFESYLLNSSLREGKILNSEQQTLADNLDSALSKIPKFEGNLARDITFKGYPDRERRIEEYWNLFVPGENITFKEYLSTTSSSDFYSDDPDVRIFIRNSKNGRDIRKFNDKEQEILYERNSSFVVKIKTIHNGKRYVVLEEKE